MNLLASAMALVMALGLSLPAQAGPREELLARYATEAKTADPAFSGFSAARGESFHKAQQTGGKADSTSCTSCHGKDPRGPGKTRTGKAIEPMAASLTPDRYMDPAKVEKWFKRNCDDVLGRACTPREKGDWLSYMLAQ